MSTAVAKVALSRKEAAQMYGVSVWTIDELVAAGDITARRMGRRILVDAASLRRWFDSLDEA